ncbi:MAG: helix-turn-helix domain-containing protein [Bacteroidota bacterium]
MNGKSKQEKIVLGLKIRQLREDQGFSASEMSKKAKISTSYLNEIEKGKKYPKPQKLKLLSAALGVDYNRLTNGKLPPNFEPILRLLESNFLNDLPLDLFKIDLPKVVELIADAPAQVGAFISTMVDLSQNYALQRESFYFAALRSYLELHDNYFEEIEAAVRDFVTQYNIPTEPPIPAAQLAQILSETYKYKIIEGGLDDYAELAKFRSVMLPKSKQLLLNSRLTDHQRAFQFGKELGFQFLKIKERAFTSSLLRPGSFNEILNHSKSIYFAVALLMNEDQVVNDLTSFFKQATWQPDALLTIMQKYSASPEMFYHRLTNILPRAFALNDLFFIRFLHRPAKNHFEVDRELHLDDRRYPHRNELNEHYCRRWIGLSSLNQLPEEATTDYQFYIQRSRYFETADEYLCLTIARANYPGQKTNVSVTLGLRIDNHLKQTIQFWDDSTIPVRIVNKTCERCPIMDCRERVASPVIVEKREKSRRIEQVLEALSSK